jgi:site-specific DNA recombinase
MEKIKNAIIVARVSTGEQRDAGNSLPAQITRMKDYCNNRQNYEVLETYSFDESAYKQRRDEFDKILDNIASSTEKIAVCFDKVDRLSRNIFDTRVALLYEKALANEIELHFVSDGQVINSAISAADKFAFGMKLGLAKYYSDAIGDNVRRVFEQKRKDGCWIGTAPFGYDNVPRNKDKRTRADLSVNEHEAESVRRIFNMYASGLHSLSSICEWLKTEKVKTKNDVNFGTSALHHLICNPFYYGVMKTSYGEFPHRYEPLIDKQLYFRVQKLLDERNNNPVKIRNTKFLFSGLFKCEKCGCTISAQKAKERYVYYHCTNAKGNCKRIYVNENVIQEEVDEILDSIALTDKQIDEICEYLKKEHDSQTLYHKEQIKKKQDEYKRCQETIDRTLDIFLEQRIDDATYEKKTSEMKTRQNELTSELEGLQTDNTNSHISARTILELAQRTKELYESSNFDQKRQILNLIFQNSTIRDKNPLFRTRKPFDTILSVKGHPILLRRQDSNLRQIDYTYPKITLRGGLYHHPD